MSANRNAEASAAISEVLNGSGAAAIVAAGTGCFLLAVLAIVTDRVPALGRWMSFYKPTGPLSGVTTIAVVAWLAVWMVLDWRWRSRTVKLQTVAAVALALLGLGLLLTFPPVADLF